LNLFHSLNSHIKGFENLSQPSRLTLESETGLMLIRAYD